MTKNSVRGYVPTIGLEVHAELKTRTKMFCDSANDPDEARPNANVCPVCMAHPGTLPTINREAVKHVLKVGAALGAELADYSEFDRKSYFYPDIPKGYQISQYAYPLVSGGELNGVAITRVHLEEDTARSSHAGGSSLVDFNRAGVPLMELVTEPVIHDAETAGAFARELQLLLRTLGVSEANLDKGQMRVEANISVAKEGSEKFGTKTEVKNINSFRAVERAIAFEIDRQINALESGEALIQETRGWDENKQQTFHQRFKEGSADYRYFPEPDLPKLKLSEDPELSGDALKAALPELPWQRRARYAELGINADAVEYLIATNTRSAFFDAVLDALGDTADAKLAANYIVTDLGGIYAKKGNESDEEEYAAFTPAAFAALVRMTAKGDLSSRGAKDVLAVLAAEGGEPEAIAKAKGLLQVHDPEALRAAVREVIGTHAAVAEEYKAGKEAALQFLLGQAMKATKGAGNPAALKELLIGELKGL
jgi:aspartyl-tRNA(Asn)/glutamyl-tRNA(Gln) amidotransferase subunit B